MRFMPALALALSALAGSVMAAVPAPAIRQAVVADCVLWTVDSYTTLAGKRVCGESAGEAVVPDSSRLGQGVLAVAQDNGDLWFAAAWFAHVSTPIRLRSLKGRELPEFELKLPEELIGFSVHWGHAVVLTSHSVMTFAPGDPGWTTHPLAAPLVQRGEYTFASPLSDSKDLYVARDAGEFGHQLFRIDARTGAMKLMTTDIVRCGWNRGYICTPGGRVVADPFHRGCVIASAVTDLLRLCIDRPPQLIELPRPSMTAKGELLITNGDWVGSLAAGDGAVFASTVYGFYRIDGDGVAPTTELPGLTALIRDPVTTHPVPMLVPIRN